MSSVLEMITDSLAVSPRPPNAGRPPPVERWIHRTNLTIAAQYPARPDAVVFLPVASRYSVSAVIHALRVASAVYTVNALRANRPAPPVAWHRNLDTRVAVCTAQHGTAWHSTAQHEPAHEDGEWMGSDCTNGACERFSSAVRVCECVAATHRFGLLFVDCFQVRDERFEQRLV